MSRVSLDKDMIIIGNVIGEHKIRDIGVCINYGQSVRLTSKQVSVSKDLMLDIKTKKIRVDSRLYSKRKSVVTQPIVQERKTPHIKVEDKDKREGLAEIVEGNAKAIGGLVSLLHQIVSEFKVLKEEKPVGIGKDSNVIHDIVSLLKQELGRDNPNHGFEQSKYIHQLSFDTSDVVSTNVKVSTERKKTQISNKLDALKKLKS